MKKTKLQLTKDLIKSGVAVAEDFEYLIKKEGLNMFNIALISQYYSKDIRQNDLKEVENFFRGFD